MEGPLKLHRTTREIAAALTALVRKKATLFFVVYHGRHRMTERPFGWGFHPTPCTCPNCGQSVREPDELRYEIGSRKLREGKGAGAKKRRT